jgi:myo-inositol-1(or 4)-monophosphatase
VTLSGADALALATRTAREAGALLREMRAAPVAGVRAKSSATDLVSDADERSERAIVGALRAARPDDSIVAEEGSNTSGSSGISWYVDPLDGTINYLYGIPHWSVTICCVDQTGPLAAVVFDPLRDELFSAERGKGSSVGGRALHVTDKPDLASALVATGFSYVARQRVLQGRVIAEVLGEVRDIRRFGSAALDLAWLAAGRHDAYFESVATPWDWMGGAMLVREAGGQVTELRPANPALPNIVASGPALHGALIALLAKAVHKAQNSID